MLNVNLVVNFRHWEIQQGENTNRTPNVYIYYVYISFSKYSMKSYFI